MLAFGIVMPILHGMLAVLLGHWAGLSVGGCAVWQRWRRVRFTSPAPPAVRMTLPEANPTLYLTASLAITFPFNLLADISIYYELSRWIAG